MWLSWRFVRLLWPWFKSQRRLLAFVYTGLGCALVLLESSFTSSALQPTSERRLRGLEVKDIIRHWDSSAIEAESFFLVLPFTMLGISICLTFFLRWDRVPGTIVWHRKDDKPTSSKIVCEHGVLLGFETSELEEQWRAHNHEISMARGARVLVIFSLFITYQRTYEIYDRRQCADDKRLKSVIFQILLRAYMLVGSFLCAIRPRDLLYWPIVITLALYVIAAQVPPFDFSCLELEGFAAQCPDKRHWTLRARRLDCSLQGHTAVQTYATVILMLPWLMPRAQYMHIAWIWIFVLYGGGSTYIRVFNNERGHDKGDMVVQLAFLCCTLVASTASKYSIERSQRNRFLGDLEVRGATKKLYQILDGMVPSHVIIPMLKTPGGVVADQVNRATILFIVIVDFDRFASEKAPHDLLKFLNKYFTKIDEICAANHVTKIETVGEEYVACVGVLPAEKEEDQKIGHGPMLERLFQASSQILQIQTRDVQFRMGMHTGPVVAGVIGNKLPRYRLFGDTINTAARMMQKGQDGQLQFGEETKQHVPDSIPIKCRGEVEMKGKGLIMAWLLDRDAKCSPAAPSENATESAKDKAIMQKLGEGDLDSDVLPELRKTSELTDTFQKSVPLLSASSADSLGSCHKQEKDNQEAFLKMLDQLGTKQERTINWSNWRENWKEVLLSETRGFTPDMEREWQDVFHQKVTWASLVGRLNRQLLALSALSCLELAYMVLVLKSWTFTHEYYDSAFRIPIFIASRAVCFALLLCWRLHWGKWTKDQPHMFQYSLTISVGVITLLFLISYDAIAIEGKKLTHEDHSHIAPLNEQMSLVFVLLFIVILSQARVSFFPSILFLPLAHSLMTLRNWTHLYISQMGRWVFILNALLAILASHDQEQTSRARFKAHTSLKEIEGRMETILEKLLPPLVLKHLREDGPRVHSFEKATISQADLVGFTQLASTRKPEEVVNLISDLFGAFDRLTEKHEVWKIETVGDAYIAGCAEEPLTPKNSPLAVVIFGLDMVIACRQWAEKLAADDSVGLRVGIHHGECIGGIVGTDMQRYHIFGHFLNVVEVLESTSVEMRVQVSKACKEAVEQQLAGSCRPKPVSFEERTEPYLCTSKGIRHELSEVGGNSYLVSEQLCARQGESGSMFAW